jgi:pimeloyl-ACP methyl ester carboxylesterase
MIVVALHGHPFDRRMWSPLAQLAKEDALGTGVAFFAPDFRGRGTSRLAVTEKHLMTLLADDVFSDIDELLPAEAPLVLAGLSMGGYVLLELLRRHGAKLHQRIAAVMLCDTKASADDEPGQERRRSLIAAMKERGMEAAMEMVPRFLSPRSRGGEVEELLASMIRETPAETACADQLGMIEREEAFSVLSDFDRPLLLVTGEDDGITTPHDAETMAEAAVNVPYVRLVTVPDAAHLTPLERPRDVAAPLAELISRVR